MKIIVCALLALAFSLSLGQQHDLKPAEALQNLAFLKGEWSGQQVFDTGGGAQMTGTATNSIADGIQGHYLCEMLSTTLPGRKPTDTRHFISYDPEAKLYRAWWFTDTSTAPLEFDGTLTGNKLVLMSKGPESRPQMRATYEVAGGKFTYMLEMKRGEDWVHLFTTTYTKK